MSPKKKKNDRKMYQIFVGSSAVIEQVSKLKLTLGLLQRLDSELIQNKILRQAV